MLNRFWQGLGVAAVAVGLLGSTTVVSAKSRLSHGTSKSRMTHGHSRSKMVHSHSHQSSFSGAQAKKAGDKGKQ